MSVPTLPAPSGPTVSYKCEAPGCMSTTGEANTYSYSCAAPKAGPGIASFQCSSLQHFGCCPEHALQALLLCLLQHVLPAHAAALTAAGVTTVTAANSTDLQNAIAAWLPTSQAAFTANPPQI